MKEEIFRAVAQIVNRHIMPDSTTIPAIPASTSYVMLGYDQSRHAKPTNYVMPYSTNHLIPGSTGYLHSIRIGNNRLRQILPPWVNRFN